MKELKTERLILKGLSLDDLSAFFDYCKNPNIGPMAGWKPHDSMEESEKILKGMITSNEVWGLYHKKDKRLIGTIGLHKRSSGNKKELGYVLREEYWGQGITPEACKAVIKYAFEEEKLHKIEIFHFPFNTQSKRVIEKMGFFFEGIRREDIKRFDGKYLDSFGYSMLKSEYEKKERNDDSAKT
ncbi:GNAT family protein [Mycoplasmatota bacterium zrk1]